MEPGTWAADPAARGAGRLQARKLAGGDVAFYYRYAGPDGERVRVPLGTGLSLAQARAAADDLSRRYQAGDRDLRGALERDAAAAAEKIKTAEAEAERKGNASLGALMDAYVTDLKAKGKKKSAGDVQSAITLHIERSFPKLWAKPAEDVDADDVMTIIDRVADAGKLRQADKLRSYIASAYAKAIRSRRKAGAAPALRAFRLVTNPARELGVVEGSSKARDRALSVAELRAYWKRIRVMDDANGAMLRFHLLTGGQRVEQLSRLTTADLDADAKTVTLRDPKGRRTTPRDHVVPLLPAAEDALSGMRPDDLGPFLFTVTSGYAPALYGVARKRLEPVVEAMLAADELPGGAFTLGDLRRTVETRLAAAGVSKEVRAHLQSHGLGGVQDRHYDRHAYIDEKRTALGKLFRMVSNATKKGSPQ